MHEKHVFIFTLHCMFALSVLFRYAHAACSIDSNGLNRFGSTCNYMCHCKDATEQCSDAYGTCITSGCANAWMGPGCQYRDIAFDEYCRHKDNINPPKYCHIANDGNISTCSSTSLTSFKPWWRLWLPRKELITGLVLITETDKLKCPAGRWGPGYGFLCGNCPGPCSGQTGHCPQGCNDGYKNTTTCKTACNNGRYGSNCLRTCGHCRNGAACQKGNGSCSDRCAPGWQGDLCKEACADGKYGSNCVETCGHCRDGASCQKDNGLCSNSCTAGWHGGLCQERCTSGWYGDNCSQECSDHCKGGYTNCNNVDGNCDLMCAAGWMGQKCDTACQDGTWGDNCSNKCGHCLTGSCDRFSGICYGGCQPGYKHTSLCTEVCNVGTYGINCNESCSENCQSRWTCDKSDGKCECKTGWRGDTCEQVCINGTWNKNCNSKCGHCLTGPCNRFNGVCSGGCQPGYKNSSYCIEECYDGLYGLNCDRRCSNNCRDRSSCNKTDGKCDCQTGWRGATCEQACKNGTWGDNCSNKCGHCFAGSCDRIAGMCYGGC